MSMASLNQVTSSHMTVIMWVYYSIAWFMEFVQKEHLSLHY